MFILYTVNIETFLRKQKSGANYDVTIRNNYIKEDDEVSQKPSDSGKDAHIPYFTG